jgi:hypothetical protein
MADVVHSSDGIRLKFPKVDKSMRRATGRFVQQISRPTETVGTRSEAKWHSDTFTQMLPSWEQFRPEYFHYQAHHAAR